MCTEKDVDVPFRCDASLTFSPLIPCPGAVAPIAVLFSDAGDCGIVVVVDVLDSRVSVERLVRVYIPSESQGGSDVVEL